MAAKDKQMTSANMELICSKYHCFNVDSKAISCRFLKLCLNNLDRLTRRLCRVIAPNGEFRNPCLTVGDVQMELRKVNATWRPQSVLDDPLQFTGRRFFSPLCANGVFAGGFCAASEIKLNGTDRDLSCNYPTHYCAVLVGRSVIGIWLISVRCCVFAIDVCVGREGPGGSAAGAGRYTMWSGRACDR